MGLVGPRFPTRSRKGFWPENLSIPRVSVPKIVFEGLRQRVSGRKKGFHAGFWPENPFLRGIGSLRLRVSGRKTRVSGRKIRPYGLVAGKFALNGSGFWPENPCSANTVILGIQADVETRGRRLSCACARAYAVPSLSVHIYPSGVIPKPTRNSRVSGRINLEAICIFRWATPFSGNMPRKGLLCDEKFSGRGVH